MVICHMMECQRKGIVSLPYGILIMKILEHIGFDLEEEESINDSISIRKHALGQMWMSIVNVVVVQKPSKA